MISPLPPFAPFVAGALVVPFLRGRAKAACLLLVPALGFANLLMMPEGPHWSFGFLGQTLTLVKADRLGLLFGYIFHIMAFLTMLYALDGRDDIVFVSGMLYVGSSLGVVFAGDLLTLFIFWEAMSLSSVMLVWERRTRRALAAGFRYLLVHVAGGVLLLLGIVLYANEKGALDVGLIGLGGLGSWLIFIGVGVNCAWPALHAWLTDAYPEAGIAGTVFLSAYTTKTAVYVLARTFPGAEPLIWIGAAMTAFPIFYAVIENDLRRVLSYSLINQVGFMVVGIGIGTELSLNGTAAHAFAHILYKALLFMSMGAVMRQTGKTRATDLGGLYKSMPLTCLFCVVGAASISAFPLFSGFVSKSMVVSATAREGLTLVWLVLLFASAGVFHHSGIKVPFFAFFSRDSGLRPKEPPLNMLLAMGGAALLCVLIGIFPGPLYSILPYPVDYAPYTASHVVSQLQLLVFSALAFSLLVLSGIYPSEMRALNLDADWLYRKGARAFVRLLDGPAARLGGHFTVFFFDKAPAALSRFGRNPSASIRIALDYVLLRVSRGERRKAVSKRIEAEKKIYPGDIIRHWPVGYTLLWVTLFLLVYLLIYYLRSD